MTIFLTLSVWHCIICKTFMPTIKKLLSCAHGLDRREALLLLAHVLGVSESYIAVHTEEKPGADKINRFMRLVMRRRKNEPIAYLVGYQPFLNQNFKVNRTTLIPRPETELLTEKIIADMKREVKRGKKSVVVDIGTGSGCIACSIKKTLPEAEVMASDSSPAALSVVKYNANKLSTGVEVIHSDLFDKKLSARVVKKIRIKEGTVLFVAANLPYLPFSDLAAMQKDVINYEPKNALFADDDGMELIKKCIQQLKKFLTPYSASGLGWYLYFEIDPRQVNELKKFAKKNLQDSKIKFEKDLCGRIRFMTAVKRV